MKNTNRIHIIGGAGSGKTYAAKALSNKMGYKILDLDTIFWDNNDKNYGKKSTPENRDAKLKETIAEKKWIIEGVYYTWLSESFRQADVILLLEPHIAKCTLRIILRFLKRWIGIIKSNKKETLKGLNALLKWNVEYNRIKLPEIKALLVQYQDKVKIYESADQVVEDVIAGLII
jgi:adenylate kinase family enzyme